MAENTLDAFDSAVAEGASWVELDARRSADDILVICHDGWTPDRIPVRDRTAAQLAEHGVIALTAALDHLPPHVGVNVEVKNLPGEPDYDPDDGIAELVAGVISSRAGSRPLLLSSFNPLTVAALVSRLPGCAVGLVHYDGVPVGDAIPLAEEFGAVSLSSNVGAAGLDAAGIGAAHDAGLEVMVWTVNDVAEAVRLVEAGADAICTDNPAAIVAGLAATRPA